ncbi:hypothetical protein E9993_10725 [Labilibacter sediminis]|nr:hypothetical protein E9993_10725 [Labilibacter sediminis]
MTADIQLLTLTAASAGFIHTIVGPDHYLPFTLIGKARNWNISKVIGLTLICGVGHILSSVILGLLGIFFGIGLEKINFIESSRGNIAAWALIAFGLVYAIWGLRKAQRKKNHTHIHMHTDGTLHQHTHSHQNEHLHIHDSKTGKTITPWVLFIIFVLGPCEVLIPLLMYPSAQKSFSGMLMVTSVFGVTTLLTMLGMVLFLSYGFSLIPTRKIGMYTHFIAGLMIFISGLAIQVFGI